MTPIKRLEQTVPEPPKREKRDQKQRSDDLLRDTEHQRNRSVTQEVVVRHGQDGRAVAMPLTEKESQQGAQQAESHLTADMERLDASAGSACDRQCGRDGRPHDSHEGGSGP
jgi:hypothetical protein